MAINLEKKTSTWTNQTRIIIGWLAFFGIIILVIMLASMDSSDRNQNVAYRVCEKYSGTRCDILDPKDWRNLSNGMSVRGPRFENIHDPHNVRQYPGWYRVEKININDYK